MAFVSAAVSENTRSRSAAPGILHPAQGGPPCYRLQSSQTHATAFVGASRATQGTSKGGESGAGRPQHVPVMDFRLADKGILLSAFESWDVLALLRPAPDPSVSFVSERHTVSGRYAPPPLPKWRVRSERVTVPRTPGRNSHQMTAPPPPPQRGNRARGPKPDLSTTTPVTRETLVLRPLALWTFGASDAPSPGGLCGGGGGQ